MKARINLPPKLAEVEELPGEKENIFQGAPDDDAMSYPHHLRSRNN